MLTLQAADMDFSFSKPIKLSKLEDMEDSEYDSDETGLDDVYNRFDFDRVLPDLPIIEMKDHILRTIRDNPIVVLEGATGCGKSTQVRIALHVS